MTDLKTEGFSTLAAVQAQLEPFRQKVGSHTEWDYSHSGSITHVGQKYTIRSMLNSSYSNSTYRDCSSMHHCTIYHIFTIYQMRIYRAPHLQACWREEQDSSEGLTKKQMIFLRGRGQGYGVGIGEQVLGYSTVAGEQTDQYLAST